jgi:predicted transcriptional regulator
MSRQELRDGAYSPRRCDPDLDAFVSEDIPYLIDLGDSDKSVDDLLGGNAAETKTDLARDLILDILEADGDQESDTLDARVARKTGLSAKTVRNVRSSLSKEGFMKPVPEKDQYGEIQRWLVVRTGAPR